MRAEALMIMACVAIVASADDVAAMNALRDVWGPNAGWPRNTSFACPSNWTGVTCADGRVQKISLLSKSLGPIPAVIGQLSQLLALQLTSTQLTGSIPSELGNLATLQSLWLQNNQLTGNIPSELGNLRSLQTLWLQNNNLIGDIPSELGNLRSLQQLWLSDNTLMGSIPTELSKVTSLFGLGLNSNQLTGAIPNELGNLASLLVLDLSSNQLTGDIPSELGKLTSLQTLGLNGNQLTGAIPSKLGNLQAIYLCDLGTNGLSCKFANLPMPCAESVATLPECPSTVTTSTTGPNVCTSSQEIACFSHSCLVQCPHHDGKECDGHGTCDTKTQTCECDLKYYGPACATYCEANTTCSGHGSCNFDTGKCECIKPWRDRACSSDSKSYHLSTGALLGIIAGSILLVIALTVLHMRPFSRRAFQVLN